MTPFIRAQAILSRYDTAQLWPAPIGLTMPQAYETALALRQLRMARGEQPRGYKIGFTNRSMWPRYNVAGPIWGTVYSSTLTSCQGISQVSLQGISQPRLEPEAVFGLLSAPPPDSSLDGLF